MLQRGGGAIIDYGLVVVPLYLEVKVMDHRCIGLIRGIVFWGYGWQNGIYIGL